ncbi:MAG: aminotransferase class III-fold pyridoxal phosphate-dependent enzyme [Flavobacteriaceae bacterium]|nr:aspartate aminotransferase family protein [Flavobacteriaceae bacterium]MDG2062216.1 aminotransferase class III-fold pyridoxal phosphate-dependent enzyme [Flavobacteriaceae bacterium]
MKLFEVYPLYEVTPLKAKGLYVYDEKRKKYLDLYGGHAVISIGHSHPYFIRKISRQLRRIGFYSNAIRNPLQTKLASAIGEQSCLHEFELFLCSSGAEAIENALKLSSFHTRRKKVIAFHGAFHGRTSAAVAVTDNAAINAPLNSQHQVTFLSFNDIDALEKELAKETYCAVIFESIQGVGGLDQPNENFVVAMDSLCKKYGTCLIADEVQSGFGRSGTFFAYQKYPITPHIITMAKGMGNGFPIGGILIHPSIKAKFGMLGTTFGGNHLACTASLAVLDILKKNRLQENAKILEIYFRKKADEIPEILKVKGRGLMLGIEFDFEVGELRKSLIYDHQIFTGGSSNKKLIRILPPLTIKEKHFDQFFKALKTVLERN